MRRVYVIHDYGDTCIISVQGIVYVVPRDALTFEDMIYATINPDELVADRIVE